MKRKADKHTLVEEGARVVTPAIESAMHFNPMAVSIGNDVEVIKNMQRLEFEWQPRRTALRTFGNQHPSEAIRTHCHEAVTAVETAKAALWSLFQSHRQPGSLEAYQYAQERHEEAVQALQDLMDEIRAY